MPPSLGLVVVVNLFLTQAGAVWPPLFLEDNCQVNTVTTHAGIRKMRGPLKKDRILKLRQEHPDWTLRMIANGACCHEVYANQVLLRAGFRCQSEHFQIVDVQPNGCETPDAA